MAFKLRHIAPILLLAATALAQDLVKESIPQKWIEQYLPEKLPELKYPAYYDDLDKAKAQAFAGRYKLALLTLKKVKGGDAVKVALVKSTALAATGRVDDALAALSDPAVRDNPSAQIAKARILGDNWRNDEAIELLKQHLRNNEKSLAGHYHLADISEQAGDIATAKANYKWIQDNYWDAWQGQGARQFEDAEEVTLMGRAFDRFAILSGAYAGNAQLANSMLKCFTKAYDLIDRGYWPAHVAAAEYYMDHGNSKDAGKELAAALAGNPNDPSARVLAGLIALEQFNFDGADQQIAAIRAVDDASPQADLLETRSLLAQRRPLDAEKPVNRVLAKQPNNTEALGLLAGAFALQMRQDKVDELLKRVEKIDPNNATAYIELAEALSSMRQYPRAEKMYEIAIQRAPWMTDARNGLGLLLTQSGDEEKAKVVLDAAYALDPFNYRTTNYLILLDKMAKMARKESDHFVLFYDAKTDPIVGEYFLEYLEGMYRSVCGTFHHQPAVKTYIEVFPTHDAFSARVTGAPWIGTVGASTGRVIALCTPRKGDNTLGTYNWAQVLRHEYTHTVTLSATDNRITHWMTEGLAVGEEQSPIRWEWVPMLYSAVKNKRLFSMDQITWAFVRPKRPQDRSLAYAQSWWICNYIAEKWGQDMLLKMMAEFKNGRTQDEVFPQLLKVSTKDFSKEFFAWAEKQVAGWGYDDASTKKYDELVKKAEDLTKGKRYAEAVAVWEEIVTLRPVDMLPRMRLAGLYLSREVNQPRKAIEQLVRLHEVSLKDDRFAKRIARIYLGLGEAKKAEEFAMQAVYIDPYDLDAHELLMEVADKSGNSAAAQRERRVVPVLAEWIKEYRKSTLLEGAAQPQ